MILRALGTAPRERVREELASARVSSSGEARTAFEIDRLSPSLPGNVGHHKALDGAPRAENTFSENLLDVFGGDAAIPKIPRPDRHRCPLATVLQAPRAHDHHPIANSECFYLVFEGVVHREAAAAEAARFGVPLGSLVGADEDLNCGAGHGGASLSFCCDEGLRLCAESFVGIVEGHDPCSDLVDLADLVGARDFLSDRKGVRG